LLVGRLVWVDSCFLSGPGKNGKNDLKFNTADPPPLKSPCSSRLHYSVSPAAQHTQELRALCSP
jgi:hypothetical protein